MTSKKKQRSCIGCGRQGQKNEFIRIASQADELKIDPDQNLDGRGVYLCPAEDCLKKAIKRKAFNYRLKARFDGKELDKFYDTFREFLKV